MLNMLTDVFNRKLFVFSYYGLMHNWNEDCMELNIQMYKMRSNVQFQTTRHALVTKKLISKE